MITVSIVSHGHGAMLENILSDLAMMPEVDSIILTLNIPEDEPVVPPSLLGRIRYIKNDHAKGFAANHNAAFQHCNSQYFCILNPDVRLPANPFNSLVVSMKKMGAALVAPAVSNSLGHLEDSVRLFPTPFRIFKKAIGVSKGIYYFEPNDPPFYPHWVAGMFMLFDRDKFSALNGLDESYFLYYEDVDICVRLWKSGFKVAVVPEVKVLHDAQRESHRRVKYLRWHLASMLRFTFRYWGRLPSPDRQSGCI
ncbi:MAG: glycosyltransferase family 2 protein [Methylophilaceae bacterium]